MTAGAPNFGLQEEIAGSWTARSVNFDGSFGHDITFGAEHLVLHTPGHGRAANRMDCAQLQAGQREFLPSSRALVH